MMINNISSRKAALAALICAVLALLLCACAPTDIGTDTSNPESEHTSDVTEKTDTAVETTDAAVIVGVKSITVYEDDSAESIRAAVLDGVTTEGGSPSPINVKITSKETGAEVGEFVAGEYTLFYYCDSASVAPVLASLTIKPADKTPPVIEAEDLVVTVGDNVSYRNSAKVTDNDDEDVALTVDASGVDLTKLGTYSVTYTATDKRGNTASKTVKITVIEKTDGIGGNENNVCTEAEFNALIDGIIKQIIKPDMTDREKARAIYDRVHAITYFGTKEGDDNWVVAAYIGLTTGRGDCQNYAAASKALLTAAGIPNHDMTRHGGTSRHFWNLVYVEGGWYHFDACWTLSTHRIEIFLLTDDEAVAYSEKCTPIPNYLIYDRDACPYEVVKSRN